MSKTLQILNHPYKIFISQKGEASYFWIQRRPYYPWKKKKRKFLQEKEETWRQNIRAIWLESGDENTKFF
jgi:hypothetical protein